MEKQQNITQDSTERWVEARFITPSGQIEVYSDYMVSDRGRIGSVVTRYGNKRSVMKIKKFGELANGYFKVELANNGKHCSRMVHRLILSSFCPEQYFPGAVVDHKNRDRKDCRLQNLHWVTQTENVRNSVVITPIKVTHLSDGHVEMFDSSYDCSMAFGRDRRWCANVICRGGFHKGLNIKIEKIEKQRV